MLKNFSFMAIKQSLLILAMSMLVAVSIASIPMVGHLIAAEVDHQHLIDTDWLSRELDRENFVVVDVRTSETYLAGHIPGAVNVPVDDTFESETNSGLAAPTSRIQELFSAAGIDQMTTVVLYDAGTMLYAARVLWILEMHGHKRVSLLNQGYHGWQAANQKVSTKMPFIEKRNFLSHVTPDRLATKFKTRVAIGDSNTTLIDVRPNAEYRGKESKAKRFGHIPNAINIPFNGILDGDYGGIKPQQELEALYSDLDKNKKVVTYCNLGQHAALTYFVLRQLGYDVAAYDGSWHEWGNDSNLPIVNKESENKEKP